MVRRRMIDPHIWEDPSFNNLSIGARLLYIGMISNADDEGYLRADPGSLKRLIFGFDSISKSKIEKWLEELQKIKTLHFFIVSDERYSHFIKWEVYQKQKKDRIQNSLYPKCNICRTGGGHMSDNVGHLPTEEKRSKVNKSEPKVKEKEEMQGKEKPIIPRSRSGSLPNGFDSLRQKAREIKHLSLQAGSVSNLLIILLGIIFAFVLFLFLYFHKNRAGTADSDFSKKPAKAVRLRPSPGAVQPIPEVSSLIYKIHGLESTWGRAVSGLHVYCQKQGMWNEYGYDSPNNFCFPNKQAADKILSDNFTGQIKAGWSESEILCYYNLGNKVSDCHYYQKSLLIQ